MNDNIITRARLYLAGMPPAIAGSGGDSATYKAALALTKGFSLPIEQAFTLLTEWNAACVPPWAESALRAKLASAGRSTASAGYLLKDDKPQQSGGAMAKEAAEKERKRKEWPTFMPLADKFLERIATLRKLPVMAVDMARSLGYLSGAVVDGHRSYVIHERHFAQARRFDGQPFSVGGKDVKAKNLPGSEGSFIGWHSLGDKDCPILLVEGVIGLVEAMAAMIAVDADARGWTVLAATSASSRFTMADLHRLRGRRVRIIPDGDRAGIEATSIWSASLKSHECTLDAYGLPEGIKDIGEALTDTETLTGIFSI